jgi:hypothetical protein
MAISQISPIIMASMSTYDRSKSKKKKEEEAKEKKQEAKKEVLLEIHDIYTPSGATEMMRQALHTYSTYSNLRR